MEYWSLHTHSLYSAKDALPSVASIVQKADSLSYPALGLTDHGTMSGAVQLYTACKKAGIQPLIGFEAYVALDRTLGKRPKTMHMCLVAYNTVGYRNIVSLSTQSHRQFRYTPVLDLIDLADAYQSGRLAGVLATSGCWFGLLPRMLREGHMGSASNLVTSLSQWFEGNFYIEIQNHMISDETHDDEPHCRLLHTFAKNLGVPTILTQDSHYINQGDQITHDALKTLVSWSDDPDDAIFPGDGYHMVDTEWMEEHHAPDIFARGMAGLEQILNLADLKIPELDNYKLVVPDVTVSGDPDKELDEEMELAFEVLFEGIVPKSKRKAYRARLDEELEVIHATGFAGYLLLVKDVCGYAHHADIRFQVRGSATGSMVCWLLGITNFNPIAWNLSFDRFLSKDQIKPPDIDLDVEHERRREIVEWCRTKYSVAGIGTSMKFGLKDGPDGDPKGSLMVAWKMRQGKMGADRNADIPPDWYARLRAIAYYNGRSEDGTPINPPIKSYGQHPAGLLIAPNDAVLATVPLQYIASSKTMVSAYDMADVEKLGLVKLDVLGLRTLTAVKVTEELSGIRCGDIPLTDARTFAMIGGGRTAGLFQLEGWTAAKGVKRMRPKKISDVIAAMALFRPAAMNSGATESYLRRREGNENIPAHHPLINEWTSDTYGVLIYQEQALGLLKALGLSIAEVEAARKAIKASNANVGHAAEVLRNLHDRITTLSREKGMNGTDTAWLLEVMDSYAGYSFNRAHATAYGVLAYNTGWFAANRPVAFWTGVLVANEDAPAPFPNAPKPEDVYLDAARKAGVIIAGAHVNRSEQTYSSDGHAIYKGIGSIKGVGPVAAAELMEHAPYQSLDDLARRVSARRVTGSKDLGRGHSPAACPGVIKALYQAGALTGLGREAK